MKKRLMVGALTALMSMGLIAVSNAEKKAKEGKEKKVAAKPVNSVCPISGKAIGDASTKVSIGVCCNKCKGKVTKNPGAYLAKAATSGDKCPLSGEEVKTKASITVGFCCNNCKGKFNKDAQANLAKVKPAG